MTQEAEQTLDNGPADSGNENFDHEEYLDDFEGEEGGEGSEEGEPNPDEEFEDVEYEGKQYKVPKELKEALLRNADYTRKTQELAESRKAVTAQANELEEHRLYSQAVQQDMAQIAAIDGTLAQYNQVDWQRLASEDPAAAQQHWIKYQQAKEQRAQLEGQIGQKTQLLQQRIAEHRQAQLEVGIKALSQEIPNFMETRKALLDYGTKAFGFTPEELTTVVDPRIVRVLHKAYLYDQGAGKKPAGQEQKASQQPVSNLKGKSSGATRMDLVKDAGKMSADEWARRRNAQIRARNGLK